MVKMPGAPGATGTATEFDSTPADETVTCDAPFDLKSAGNTAVMLCEVALRTLIDRPSTRTCGFVPKLSPVRTIASFAASGTDARLAAFATRSKRSGGVSTANFTTNTCCGGGGGDGGEYGPRRTDVAFRVEPPNTMDPSFDGIAFRTENVRVSPS